VPDIQREKVVPVEVAAVWRFVADMNNWATHVPGYRQHTMISDRESLWQVAGDIGILSREVELRVLITEWREPSEVSFTLEGTEEPVEGSGRFTAAAVSPSETGLGFELSLTSSGPMGPVINVLLGTQLPRIAEQFVAALVADLERDDRG
jgi:carbon monoxide dehydrogenase subunit G